MTSTQSNGCDFVVEAQLIVADGEVRSALERGLREQDEEVVSLALEELDLQPAGGRIVQARFAFALDFSREVKSDKARPVNDSTTTANSELN